MSVVLAPPRDEPRRVRGRTAIAIAAWLYLLIVLLEWALFRAGGDRWWIATVMLYAPRWMPALPLAVLGPLALWRNRRALWGVAAATLVVFGPVMGFCVPGFYQGDRKAPTLRVLTCNVEHGINAREALAALVASARPDVVVLQECSPDAGIVWPDGWHVHQERHLVVASRYPLVGRRHSVCTHPENPWPPVNGLACVAETPQGKVAVCCVHLQSPRAGLESVLDRQTGVDPARRWTLDTLTTHRRWESEELAAWIGSTDLPTIVAGDFNMPVDSTIYRKCWSSFTNAFSSMGLGFGYTKVSGKRLTYGARIDHVLFNRGLGCRSCKVESDIGSDHRPLIAELVLDGR
ncbi:MAG: endonuclease/exonuclease/phosphatase family protein [Planctomycetia bacterium]|nr:endonuclease/exonuclease/phosphatase family protein [Planctomycetia bacterium]